MTKTFQAPATLTSVAFTADGGLRLTFHTQELTAEEKVIASQYHQQFGWLLFKANEFSTEDIPKDEASDEGKSPSQRLRAVLFVAWQQRGAKGDFESYYRRQMQRITDRVKEALDD